ncbi:hypothetical protein FDUTEX481_07560 [Tolypothrix sp. PCC 7601]|nr:hypothetical protein FDUTEX481_07560 [Tolypothrix sp. PCC 7601]
MSTERETLLVARFRPHPQPLSHREKGARDLVPLLLREKGLGDEGARYLYNARPISLLA